MNARDRRFWEFIRNHRLVAEYLSESGVSDPDVYWRYIEKHGFPAEMWRTIKEEFDSAETLRAMRLSRKREKIGRPGRKRGGSSKKEFDAFLPPRVHKTSTKPAQNSHKNRR